MVKSRRDSDPDQPHASARKSLILGVADVNELAQQIKTGTLRVQVGKTFHLDEIVLAHRLMEENKAGGKIVVLT